MLNILRIRAVSLLFFEMNVLSMCAMTACTSEEQFFGMCSSTGVK